MLVHILTRIVSRSNITSEQMQYYYIVIMKNLIFLSSILRLQNTFGVTKLLQTSIVGPKMNQTVKTSTVLIWSGKTDSLTTSIVNHNWHTSAKLLKVMKASSGKLLKVLNAKLLKVLNVSSAKLLTVMIFFVCNAPKGNECFICNAPKGIECFRLQSS